MHGNEVISFFFSFFNLMLGKKEQQQEEFGVSPSLKHFLTIPI